MLNSAAGFLNGKATALAELRDAFDSSCEGAKKAFGSNGASRSLAEFFQAWFSAFDAQAETMGSVADATQQCAVTYDHAERTVLGYIPAMPTAPPPRQKPDPWGRPQPPIA
jgi:hypothetical protein